MLHLYTYLQFYTCNIRVNEREEATVYHFLCTRHSVQYNMVLPCASDQHTTAL